MQNMGTEVANIPSKARLPSLPQWIASAISSVSETMEDGRRRYFLPTGIRFENAEITAIEGCLLEAESQLVPAIRDSRDGTKAAIAALENLFTIHANQTANDGGIGKRIEIYICALGDLPAHAIVDAVDKWLRGEAGNHDYHWAPVPAILREVALSVISPARSRAQQVRRLLAAMEFGEEQPTEGERERIAAGFKDLIASMGAGGEEAKKDAAERLERFTMETNRRFFERECAEMGFPVDSTISPSLAASIKQSLGS